ncbi:HPr family phosphocarrier protein [Metabacillus litoralis]|uniref:HPr family phosphocarrier protein n=1 Tax=Metabacillus TaxID=2675233 RepID=UPI000EF60825|nr:HPr family phosphocarrier protein [Metabacillus litoralis]MCM3163036.1 HPr family phosphocarrier protein [Metabacillus litoralis]MCM3410742.1 HPr family phosphocarrier protein [Metabacillus litoralis]UHA58172.1 HPr family phosphocarrier protein [Metabacillus litoralis]
MRVKDLTITRLFTVNSFIEVANIANKFESEIMIVGPNFKTDAKSLLGLLATIQTGTNIRIEAAGEDEEEAIKECIKLFL